MQQLLFSPAELAYLHSSLTLKPPIRPDGRTPTQFRPLTAETGVLPGTNGSARVCFADGTEALVGVKAEIEKTADALLGGDDEETARGDAGSQSKDKIKVKGDWLEMAVEIPGHRDDDAATVFLAEMLRESLLADGEFAKKLYINSRFHWRLYLDVSCGLLEVFTNGQLMRLCYRFCSYPLHYPIHYRSSPSRHT
jgi:exosome complex component RRP42